MSAGHIGAAVLAAAIAVYAYRRREKLTGELRLIALAAVVILGVVASGVLSGLPSLETIVKDLADALGSWTYALVGAMAFLETGAFVGFVAPGEFTVILGGVIAGEGEISILPLIGLVWLCAVAGDSVSFMIGHRVGRQFMLRHGPRIRITEDRFRQVEDFFDRHGGKTIVIGRFLGFVRPLAPFIAGTSRMTYGRFLPYSVLGTGLWGSTFCLVGYIFWHSFDRVSKIAGRATLALGILAALIAAGVYAYRRLRDPAEREKLERWLERHPVLGRAWRWAGRPLARFTWPQIRFLWGRITPGNLGIEFTSSLAVAAAGAYVFVFFASMLHDDRYQRLTGDAPAFTVVAHLRNDTLNDVAKLVTQAGALPFTLTLVAIGSLLLIWKQRPLELFALAGGFGLVVLAVHLAKDAIDRPRPLGSLVETVGSGFPSGHAAYATVYVAMAVIASRVLGGIVSRAALVLAALIAAAVIGATRVYLRAHYLSDVLGGFALGLSILAFCGAVALVAGHVRNNGPQ
jgi:membrane protein DedA with SNARE-associated domain/membrane-associated phospholipid phosphatase